MDLLLAMGAYFIQGVSYILFHRYMNLSKPKPHAKTFSLISTSTTSGVDPQKELRNHKICMFAGGGIALGLTFWLSIPALIKVTFLMSGVAAGFLVGIVRFNHWNDLIEHESQMFLKQNQPKNQLVGLGLLAFWLVGIWVPIHVRTIIGGDISWLGIVALGLVASAFYCGYYLEHLLLYQLNKRDSQLPTPDDPM